jgi:hypothetical protein
MMAFFKTAHKAQNHFGHEKRKLTKVDSRHVSVPDERVAIRRGGSRGYQCTLTSINMVYSHYAKPHKHRTTKVILPQLIAIITFVVVAVNVTSIVPLGAADARPSSTRQESSIKAVDEGGR